MRPPWALEKRLPASHRGDIQPQMPPLPPGWGTQRGMLGKVEELKSNPSELPPPFPVSSIPSAAGEPSVPLGVKPMGKIPLERSWKRPRAVRVTEVTSCCPHCLEPGHGQTQIKTKALPRKPPQYVLQPLIGSSSLFHPREINIPAPHGLAQEFFPRLATKCGAGLG